MNNDTTDFRQLFYYWMLENLEIKESTAEKYLSALDVVDKNVNSRNSSVFIVFSPQIKRKISEIDEFIEMNKRGNNMYSAALNHYESFYNSLNKENKTMNNYICDINGLNVFLNLPVSQIAKELNVSNNISVITRELTSRFLNEGNFRSIRRNVNGTVQESIPLDNIDFVEIINEEFQESDLYKRFDKGFHFLVYDQMTKNKKSIVLKYGFIWKPDDKFINSIVRDFWSSVVSTTRKGVKIERVPRWNKYINVNNLPGSKDNQVLHVRPKAKNAADTSLLPTGGCITKQAYWINNSFIKSMIEDMEENMLSDSEVVYHNFDRKTATQKKTIRKNIRSVRYSKEHYIERLEKYSGLKVIYTKNDYKKIRKTYKSRPKLKEIINKDYDIKYGYYVNRAFNSITDAIEYDVLNLDYLYLSNYEFKDLGIFYNLFNKLRKKHQLIEVEKDVYITENNLKKGGVSKSIIDKFIQEVQEFSLAHEPYFNVYLLKINKIAEKMFVLGFQNIFYEELLRNSGKFQYQTFRGNIIFTTSTVDSSVYTDLVRAHILESKYIYRHEINEKLEFKFGITNISHTDILSIYDITQGTYYCKNMDMFFVNEELYMKIILRRI